MKHRVRKAVIFPTGVGVFLHTARRVTQRHDLPHRRGGVSPMPWLSGRRSGSSPQAWGCFCGCVKRRFVPVIFPTGVGVFPGCTSLSHSRLHLPHRRGGVSIIRVSAAANAVSSPQAWGCFRITSSITKSPRIFPTGVGVFLQKRWGLGPYADLPHRRGGVSRLREARVARRSSSPQAWGCFHDDT